MHPFLPRSVLQLGSGFPYTQRRQWHPTPVLLPGKSHGRRSLVGSVHGVAEGWTRLSDFIFTFHFHALEKEMATHASLFAWRIPGTGQPGGLLSMGSQRVGHDWSALTFPYTRLPWWLRWYRLYLQCRRPGFHPWVGKIPWRREGPTTPVFLPGESYGQRRYWRATVQLIDFSLTLGYLMALWRLQFRLSIFRQNVGSSGGLWA